MLFTIKQLIEHVQTTSGQVGNRWIPVRPLQLTGLGGLKQRIVHAYRVLKGELDVVDWSVKKTSPRELRGLVVGETLFNLVPGVMPTSIKVVAVGKNANGTTVQTKAKMDWVKVSGNNPFWEAKVTTEQDSFSLRYDESRNAVLLISSKITAVAITYLVE